MTEKRPELNPGRINVSSAQDGSSPQARGTHDRRNARVERVGLIPAGAGNTASLCVPFNELGAHPRRRGEHVYDSNSGNWIVGSSPQARGTRGPSNCVSLLSGLIPAGAGNTGDAGVMVMGCGAHPRRRGEHFARNSPFAKDVGSSPQARGTPDPCECPVGEHRLIPAGAGNTPLRSPPHGPTKAHPRRRGEHI